jgi:hypothetical protein
MGPGPGVVFWVASTSPRVCEIRPHEPHKHRSMIRIHRGFAGGIVLGCLRRGNRNELPGNSLSGRGLGFLEDPPGGGPYSGLRGPALGTIMIVVSWCREP